eukprot:gene14701-17369_t
MADEQVCCAALAADVWDEACLMCGDGGELVCCDFCPRVYHLPCIGLQHLPGGIWECPSCQGLVEPIPGLCWVDNSVGQVAATPPQGLNPLDETASELRDAAASLPRHVWEGLVLVHIHRDVRSRKLAKWRLARLLPMEVVRRTSEVYEQSRDPAQALVQGLFEIHAQGRGAEPQQSKTHHIAGAAEPPPCRQDSAFAITPDTQQHCNVPTFAADDLGGHLLSPERASCQVARHGIPAASSPDQKLVHEKRQLAVKNVASWALAEMEAEVNQEHQMMMPGPSDVSMAMDVWDEVCLMCGDGGELACCDYCPHVYHLKCIGLQHLPGGMWECPSCQVAIQRSDFYDLSEEEIEKLKKLSSPLTRDEWVNFIRENSTDQDVTYYRGPKWKLVKLLTMPM